MASSRANTAGPESPKYVVGIDGGSQSSKVSIFDLKGNCISTASKQLKPLNKPRLGVAEHPDDDIWQSIASACREAMNNFNFDPRDIVGIGVCTIRCCRAELNQEGALTSPILSWMDERVGQPHEWTHDSAQYLTTTSGYIGFRLTACFKDTVANYEGLWPLDKKKWGWLPEQEFRSEHSIKRENLFDLVLPGEKLGVVTKSASQQTGLPIGLPVIATANDKAVEALGAGLAGNKTALISLGTYIGGMVYGRHYLEPTEHFFTNLSCVPHRYLYECAGIRHGMNTVSWFRDLFGDYLEGESHQSMLSVEEILNREAACIAPGSDGLITLPEWLAPYDQAHKRGAMLGFNSAHTRAHIYRSILESIALTMTNHLRAMQLELGYSLNEIIVSGGGSKSEVLMQILADSTGLPTTRNKVADAAGLGAAICAGVAVGVYADFDQAANAMVQPSERFEPNSQSSQLYDEINQNVFVGLRKQLDPVFASSHKIFNSQSSGE